MKRSLFLLLLCMLCMPISALAQQYALKGVVKDETGEGLPGVSILVKGTSRGAATDIDGSYTINVAKGETVVFSYVGCLPQSIKITGQKTLDVTMKATDDSLDEVIVVGYGSQSKRTVSSSIASVDGKTLENSPNNTIGDGLKGKIAGVRVFSSDNTPGAEATFIIRGGSSISQSNAPLILVDGVERTMEGLNPNDIESIQVLKDAASSAIYGSRASNGVIIITTKKGRSGRPQVTFTANFYVDYARKLNNLLDANQFANLINEKAPGAANLLGNTSTDWQNEIFRTSFSSDYSLSVAGALGILPYRVSASYTNNNGILRRSNMDRATVGITLTPKFFDDHLSITANVKGYYVHNNWGQEGAIGQAVAYNPTIPVHAYAPITGGTAGEAFKYLFNGYNEPYTVAGGVANLENNATYNPVATIEQSHSNSKVWRSNGNIQFDYSFHFLPELHANLNLGYDVSKSNDYYSVDANSHMAWKDHSNYGGGYMNHQYQFRSNTLLEFFLNYKKELEDTNSLLDLTAGYTWSRDYARGWNLGSSSEAGIRTTPGLSPAIPDGNGGYILNYTPGTEDLVGQPFKKDDKDAGGNYHWKNHLQLLSFFGRMNLSWLDKYLFTVTVRGDATSRFSKDHRWGVFPAVALGWRINQEEFMESTQGWLTDLKLRLGWGETGQQAVGSYYNYLPLYTPSQPGSYYPNGQGGWLIPFFPEGYNPDLKWETTATWNVGLDFGFINNRIIGNIEWYLRDTRDLLSVVPVPAGSSTVSMLPQNIGNMRNYGIEFNINAKPIVTDDFTWTLSYNIGWNHNKITNLDGNQFAVGGGGGVTGSNVQIQKEGYPMYSFNLYQQVYDQNGKPVEGAYVDQNADGEIETNDLIIRHSRDPKVTMTFGSNFRWKKWDLGFSLRASIGNYVYADALRAGSLLDGLSRNNQLSNVYDTDTYFNVNAPYSDYWLRNASFLRCDNITLGYTFDNLWKERLRLRLFAAVQNPFVITQYDGLDPEVFSGVDGNIYPRATTWSLGLVATF